FFPDICGLLRTSTTVESKSGGGDGVAFANPAWRRTGGVRGAAFRNSGLMCLLGHKLAGSWPATRLVEVWNSFAGVAPFDNLKPVKKFTDRKAAVARIWEAIQRLAPN